MAGCLKDLIDRLKMAESGAAASPANASLYGAILLSLILIKTAEKTLKGVTDSSVVVALQRHLVNASDGSLAAPEISKMTFDCVEGKKGIEIAYKDVWKLTVGIVSVIGWQASLAAEWLLSLIHI